MSKKGSSLDTPRRIGFVGHGLMGKPMAQNLLKGHHEVNEASRSQPPVSELCQLRALRAIDVAVLTTWADLVTTMLPTSLVTTEVVRGRGALVEKIRSGTILINMSTETPALALEIHDKAADHGHMQALDAPISGGDTGAMAGTPSIMVGGPSEAFSRG